MITQIKKLALNHPIKLLSGFVFLLGLIGITEKYLSNVPTFLPHIIVVLLLVIYSLLWYAFIHSDSKIQKLTLVNKDLTDQIKKITEKKWHMGLFWDHNKNPLCPKCDFPLIQYPKLGYDPPMPVAHCQRCAGDFELTDPNKCLTIEEARETLPS
jgi:hypothetical protein